MADKKTARENPAVVKAVEEVGASLGDDGRILVRESGTEPVIRVMVEAADDELCEKYVNQGRSRIKKEIDRCENMLHIILAILKIIGILLAVVLGLLVLGVLLILFVPLRYQLDFERGTGSNLARGRFGWLAHLIMVTAKLEDNKPHVTVRICWFTKQLVPAAEKKEKPPGKRKQEDVRKRAKVFR